MMEADQSGFLHLLHQHLAWYPQMELRDVYKLIYQGAMGSEHLAIGQQEFTLHLQAEFDNLWPDQHHRLLEPVRMDATLYRLNLRPYKARNLDLDSLIPLLVQTSRLMNGTKNELIEAWGVFMHLCERGEISSFQIPELRQFNHWLEQEDYPVVHHSHVYRREYQPAYRLISAQFIPELGLIDAG